MMGKKELRTDWRCSNDHRCSIDRRQGIAGKSQAKVITQVKLSVIIFRGIVSPSLARVQTTQEGGGIQFGCNGVQEKMSRKRDHKLAYCVGVI